jgi:nucleotide-binding universal stress UspA family protein
MLEGSEEAVMKCIVVGVDGSAESAGALTWAASLALKVNAEVVVVQAYTPVASEIRPKYAERVQDEHLRRLEGSCGSRLEGIPHRLEAVNGDAREVLPAMARDLDADLLVVASIGMTGREPGFLSVGSVVEYLAHHVEVPLAVVPPGTPTAVAHIVVGLDGSEHSAAAARWTADLAGATGAAVTVVAVDEAGSPLHPEDDVEGVAWSGAAEARVTREWAGPLADFGDRYHCLVSRETPVADTILRAAEHDRADLVVVGVRGLGGITGLRVGGVALGVLHRADRPVVLVPAATDGQ